MDCPFICKHVLNNRPGRPVVFEESVKLKLQATRKHQESESNLPPRGRRAQPEASWLHRRRRLTGEGSDVVIVVWYGRVSLGVCVVVVANSTVERTNMAQSLLKGSAELPVSRLLSGE